MAERDDFVDLTPNSEGKKEVYLSEQDMNIIEKNPRRLTKEGIMHKVWLWYQANNPLLQMRYLAMYKLCKDVEKSITLEDGNVILSRRKIIDKKGFKKVFETKEKIGQKDHMGEFIIAPSVEELREFVESKLPDLKFVTRKGVV